MTVHHKHSFRKHVIVLYTFLYMMYAKYHHNYISINILSWLTKGELIVIFVSFNGVKVQFCCLFPF